MYKYVCPPIDWFYGCMSLSQFLSKTSFIDNNFGVIEGLNELSKTIKLLTSEMKSMPMWEGDIIGDIYVFALPNPNSSTMDVGFIWKQESNGTTFVLSPIKLDWLQEYEENIAAKAQLQKELIKTNDNIGEIPF
jgi:hypothetical protein